MNDGSFTFGWTTPTDRQRPGTDSGDPACTGKFVLSHGVLQIRWTNDSCQGPISLVWKQKPGALEITVTDAASGDRAALSGTWVKVG